MRVYDACVEVRGELEGAPLSCHYVGPGDEIQTVSLGRRCLNPLTHLTGLCPTLL